MGKNRISEFLESIDSTKWNCVYQANGMTLLTAKEYNYRYEEIDNLRKQCKKQKEVIDKAIEFTNKNWGTWCTHHLEYMTELQNILKEVSE